MTATTSEPVVTRPRRRVPVATRVDFWLDGALLVAFALDYSFRFTPLSVHEWIGLALGVALVAHVTLHWDWVLRTTKKLLSTYAGREKLRWIVDFALLGAMTFCIGSGILISPRRAGCLRHRHGAQQLLDRVAQHERRRVHRVGRRTRRTELALDRDRRAADAGSRRRHAPGHGVKFVRRMLAVLAVVAVVMVLAIALGHSPAEPLFADRHVDRFRGVPAAAAPSDRFVRDGGRDRGNGSFANVDDLVQTTVVLALIVTGVVVVDRARRRRGNPRTAAAVGRA